MYLLVMNWYQRGCAWLRYNSGTHVCCRTVWRAKRPMLMTSSTKRPLPDVREVGDLTGAPAEQT